MDKLTRVTLCLILTACPLLVSGNPLQDKGRPVAQTEALSPEQTVEGFVLPDGFSANVFAAEPDIVQPIAHTMDDRGRIWVLENTNYPSCPGEKKDRIVILEDADGDGIAEKKSVFFDKMSFASGIAVGHGGVWVGAPPNLLFFPRKENEDTFQGEPQIVLDGWGGQDTHETLNNFIWGPDGWLYGTQGIFTHSNVGQPGASNADRVKLNAGIWRYHPKKKIFERYAEGASNQWGLDFNDRGQAFFAACVISHMWEGIQGARYSRQAGAHFDPHTYENITTIANFSYEKRAYCGAMIYLGDQWPLEYRDTFFFGDIHMNKLRNEKFVRNGSGHASKKNGDFLFSKDPWYRGLNPQYGPDGSVFVSDWYDRVPCHQQKAYTDRSNGRIYRITYGKPKPVVLDLSRASSKKLVEYQLHRNDWFVRHSRSILAERGPDPEVHAALKKILSEHPDETRKLRALWALHVTDGLDEETLLAQLTGDSEYLRAWAVQLACEDRNPSDALMKRFSEMADRDPSPLVRRYLASAAGRIDVTDRKKILIALAAKQEDADDPNIPQLIWYAAEPLVAGDPDSATELLRVSQIPLVSRCIARRLCEKGDTRGIGKLVAVLAGISSDPKAAVMVAGANLSLKGRKNLAPPAGWEKLYPRLATSDHGSLQQEAKKLAAAFGGKEVIAELRALVFVAAADIDKKHEALETLIALEDPEVHGILIRLLQKPGPLRAAALRGLADFPTTWKPATILGGYQNYSKEERKAALATLVSNKDGADAVVRAVDSGIVPKVDLSAQIVRQIQGLNAEELNIWITKNWGAVRKTSEQKRVEIAEYRKFLGEKAILNANASNGRAIFSQRCAACHKLHGEGMEIGPELPGNFKDTGYLLLNLLDPNATIGNDYQQTFITKANGQVVSGVIVKKNTEVVVLKTLAGIVSVNRGEVKSMTTSEQSLMPEGLMNGLEEPEIRDLFLYLRQASQVPLPSE